MLHKGAEACSGTKKGNFWKEVMFKLKRKGDEELAGQCGSGGRGTASEKRNNPPSHKDGQRTS